MTKTTRTNTNTKTSTSAAGTTPEMAAEEAGRIINDTLDALRPGLEVPVAARDFVAGQAATAQARLEDARKGATELNAQAGNAAVSLAGTYAGFAKTMIDISAANASHALSAAEKARRGKDDARGDADPGRLCARQRQRQLRPLSRADRHRPSDRLGGRRHDAGFCAQGLEPHQDGRLIPAFDIPK
jgi:hypothetical protein